MEDRPWPLFLFFLIPYSLASICKENTTLSGFSSDLSMVQHQLRGVVRILDGCSFSVSQFDMLPGSDRVRWWGASGDSFHNLTLGFQISNMNLNHTYGNESFTVRLLPNVSWDQMSVLAVWDEPTASDFGHLLLGSNYSDILTPTPDISPAPSPNSDSIDAPPTSRRSIYTQPTMFDNCLALSPDYRLRWTLLSESNSIAIGLEAAVGSQYYMAFGWADPGAATPTMMHADIVVAGFSEEGIPFAEDYFITEYSECLLNKDGKVEGVCPDTIYEGSDPIGLVNNTKLVYGHRRDGIAFVRYERPIVSRDEKYDIPVNKTGNMSVIWALGLIRPPDTLHPYYLPQNHGGPKLTTYGFFTLNLSKEVNECAGPLDAKDKEDQDLIIADGKTPLIVTAGPALHYPNPPNPDRVIYINKKEAPHLRVERGVPVTFSIQAGHDLALYITSDPIGGNASSRNMSETIFAGGVDAEGVPASPKELIWAPDRNTPDQVYYQSFFEQKMGWKVQVVDGGLSDMYNNSVLLDDQQVTLFWTLSDHSITLAARGEKKSSYLAIGFGSGMVDSYVYIGWIDDVGVGHVNTYWIDGKDPSSVHPTSENLTYVRCRSENGIITFEFTRPLNPYCNGRVECKNIIDPTTPLKVIWAMGARWSAERLSEKNMHSVTSSKPVRVLLLRGSAEAEQDLRPVLAVHGFMMFIAWGILLPGGIMAARYLKHVKGDSWYQTHVYLQYSGIAIVLLGVLFAAAELRGFYISSPHVKFGVAAIVLACIQPINAYLRPKRPTNGEALSRRRVIWEYFHAVTGRFAILAGIVALFTGMKHLGNRYDSENVEGLTWALIIWFLLVSLLVLYLEYLEVQRSRKDRDSLRGNWVLGNDEEDDSVDLLHPKRTSPRPDYVSSTRMEVQLEPIR
ncbi:cytochrome b561, DM13 and DOMON domain-containing protein At5g54830 [Phalaenopsis equestris]|uniref:cytochrome b561, DM13 and DOMON domain-containing protein At5g54830 n=1 Tax=Phalaenopsis equestris TaxID=78828 RepID=UPI0009E30E7E|nr:cytochrome b561, DM13 and DOMON domain-containing protein At5g54830 [Phalaenopsis equestris]XP_020593908.1 cytochrome b561, DM13 and DOMON domain-containing protein At5g54830 [Phalaenopsis equestris]